MEISKEQYEYALNRIEELLPLVDDNTPVTDNKAIELSIVSEMVIAYEEKHYPMEKPTVGELIRFQLEDKGISQKQLAQNIGVSPSRVSEFVNGKAEPSLRVAGAICGFLGIAPSAMLGL